MVNINSIDVQVRVVVDTQAMNSFTNSIKLMRTMVCAVQMLVNMFTSVRMILLICVLIGTTAT